MSLAIVADERIGKFPFLNLLSGYPAALWNEARGVGRKA
jgi:hypothetical protein